MRRMKTILRHRRYTSGVIGSRPPAAIARFWREVCIRVVFGVAARHDHVPGIVAAEQEDADERLVVGERCRRRRLRADRAGRAAEGVGDATGRQRPAGIDVGECDHVVFSAQRCTANSGEARDEIERLGRRAAPACSRARAATASRPRSRSVGEIVPTQQASAMRSPRARPDRRRPAQLSAMSMIDDRAVAAGQPSPASVT